MSFSFHEQMRFIRQDYNNKIINSVFPHDDWDIQDYKDFHLCIENGYLVQECGSHFKIGLTDDFTEDTTDDFYTQHFSQHLGIEETNDDCESCGIVLSDDDVCAGTGKCEQCEDEAEDDETTIQYRKEIEEGCPKGYTTIWNSHGFSYEKCEKEAEAEVEQCGCESDDEYSVSKSGCDNLACGEEDKSDYYIVYGEYHEVGIDPIWGAEKYKKLKEALAEFNLKKKYDYDAVYLDEMVWDEDADEWEQDNVEFWSRDPHDCDGDCATIIKLAHQ